MTNTKECTEISERISEIIKFAESIPIKYESARSEVVKLDDLTQDYLHKLELENLTEEEYAKSAMDIAECRKERRKSKDLTEVLTPVLDFLEQNAVIRSLNLLKETLGKVRKIEERLDGRKYGNRVLSDSE